MIKLKPLATQTKVFLLLLVAGLTLLLGWQIMAMGLGTLLIIALFVFVALQMSRPQRVLQQEAKERDSADEASKDTKHLKEELKRLTEERDKLWAVTKQHG